MIKAILLFIFLAFFFGTGISAVRRLTNRQKWTLTKVISYAVLCSALSVFTIVSIVVIF